MANRQGLVAVKRTVTRDGKTYTTTVWIRPGDQNKVKPSHVAIPDWHFKDANELVAEVDRIHALKDPSEKHVLKEHLIEDLKKFGIKWKEDTGSKADAVNWMRAMMSAKKHLNGGKEIKITDKSNATGSPATGTQPSQPAPAPQPQRQPIQAQPTAQSKVVLGTGQPMSKDDAKKAIQDLQKQLGTQGLMDLAEKNGIQWAKNPNHVANSYMQCAMKLSKHLQGGGTLTDSGSAAAPATPAPAAAQTPQPTKANAAPAPAPTPAAPPQPVGPKPMTLAHDYHNASPKQKLIGLVTGIIPTDNDTTAYIEELMKKGMFDLQPNRASSGAVNNAGSKFQYGLPKAYYNAIHNIDEIVSSNGRSSDKWRLGRPDSDSDEMFKGSAYEKEYEEYKKAHANFVKNYSEDTLKKGTESIKLQVDTVEVLKELSNGKPLGSFSQYAAVDNMIDDLAANASNPAKAQQVWDKYGFDVILDGSGHTDNKGVFKSIMDMSSSQHYPYVEFYQILRDKVSASHQSMMHSTWTSQIQNGSLSKESALKTVISALEVYKQAKMSSGADRVRKDVPITAQMQSYINDVDLIKQYLRDNRGNNHENFDADGFLSFAKQAADDFKPLVSNDSDFIRGQIVTQTVIGRNQRNSNLTEFDDYKPMDRVMWENASDKKEALEEHFYAMRKKGNARDKFMNQKAKERDAAAKAAAANPQAAKKPKKIITTNFLAEWKKGTDPSSLEFPDHEDVGHWAHCSLDKVPDAEVKKIAARIEQTHDNVNHRSFKTKVNGAYRIKNLPYEEEFKKIDAGRNNTSFYYHGTDFKATQKILGASGQFVVTPKAQAKAGRMLGDGVYLAEQSSKSMQYVGGQYVPGGLSAARGVLFVCKASLGKVVESSRRGYDANQPLLSKKENDTLAMLRPHVVNPEWAVKEEKAVMPRLWIDVERV